jgi:hypothetical protein
MKNRCLFVIAAAGAAMTLASAALGQTAVSSTLTYQARLDDNGVPYEGTADLDIAAYDAASGGAKIGQQVIQTVGVSNGLFTVEYDPGVAAFESNVQMWLEVKVRTAGGAWNTLPRQKVTAAPFSTATRGVYVAGSGSSARVGVGAPAPAGFRFSVDETTNAPAIIRVDSGQNAAQISGIQLADRNTLQWALGKNALNSFYFERMTNDPAQVTIGSSSVALDSSWSTQLVLRGRDVGNTNGTAGVIFENTSGTFRWEVGQEKDGTFSFRQTGGDKHFVSVPALEIRGGSDIAEPYDIAAAGEVAPVAGMVVSIDPDRVGSLRVSDSANDRMVAGIISGANGVNTGLTLTQEGSIADGEFPVAKVGRVWCMVDASAGAVRAGDLLTTSDTPGHAQKVVDHAQSQGAVLGKAMSTLESGRGYVLVLVGLQ